MATADVNLDSFGIAISKVIQAVLPLFLQFNFTDGSAAGLSAISGLNVISEKAARKSADNVKPITLKELFHDKCQVTDQIFYIPDSEYDPQYDYDFTNYKGDDTNCTRGGYSYKRPAGWNRKAVRVIGKYEDDIWLGQQGWRDGSSPGEWVVSYHGTKRENVSSIVRGGYDTTKCIRKAFGPGIYSTPDFLVAERYATEFIYNGEKYKCILQNRVNLQKTESNKTLLGDGIYFRSPSKDDIRPYGVCIKKI